MATVGEDSVYTFTVSSDSENIDVIILHEGEENITQWCTTEQS